MDTDLLRKYLEFYQDLGIKTLYQRPTQPDVGQALPPASVAGQAEPPPDSPARPVPVELPPLAPAGETLFQILADIGDCRRCRLHEGRNKIVFGDGNERSPLVFVGEGPGADEDAQGIPFVGRAGQLLTQMIENTAKKEGIPLLRQDVYICNVVKCRPPGNRTPEPDEMEICGQFLYRQLLAIRPKAICALGGTAARAVTGHKEGVTKMRGKWFNWKEIPVLVTYHPSYLLRPYNQGAKREAWEDLKKVLHFVYD
jgi:uracil-DNA glycosylase family 4